MLVEDLLKLIDRLAPFRLAQPWDNSGLLVGDAASPVQRVLAALELTEPVLREAVSGGFDTVITHHPLLFEPVRSLVESRPKEQLLRGLVAKGITLVACHTNLDAAAGGLADIAAEALGLKGIAPLQPAETGWVKFVGFVPVEAVERVAAAVFAESAGGVGRYSECAFASEGTGWFTPGTGSEPAVGRVGQPERTAEVRWETVVPKERVGAVVRAFVNTHPYEEPAFDLFAVESTLLAAGLGRVGDLPSQTTVRGLSEQARRLFQLSTVRWSGDGDRTVRRVGVLPGSGRGSVAKAWGLCDVLVTGDLSYHDGEASDQGGPAVIDVPHGDIEWWAFKKWCLGLGSELSASGVCVCVSTEWRALWSRAQAGDTSLEEGM